MSSVKLLSTSSRLLGTNVRLNLTYYSREGSNLHITDINIDVYDPTKETAKVLRGHLLLYLRVSRLATFTSTDGVFSASDLQAIPQDVISWLSLEQVQKLSPAWNQFLLAFYSVVSQTLTLFQVPQAFLSISWKTNYGINCCRFIPSAKSLSRPLRLQSRLEALPLPYNFSCIEYSTGSDRSDGPG